MKKHGIVFLAMAAAALGLAAFAACKDDQAPPPPWSIPMLTVRG